MGWGCAQRGGEWTSEGGGYSHGGRRRRAGYDTQREGARACAHLKGHDGAWAPRQPQWQHWGAEAARMQAAGSAAGHWAAAEGAPVGCECAEDATERAEVGLMGAVACMVDGGW